MAEGLLRCQGCEDAPVGMSVTHDDGCARKAKRYHLYEETTWPVNLVGDDEIYGLEHTLRYQPDLLTREDHLVLASVVAAYVHLTSGHLTQKQAFESLRRARHAAKEALE